MPGERHPIRQYPERQKLLTGTVLIPCCVWARSATCLSRKVRVQFLDPVDHGDAVTVGMRWAATGVTGGLFPVLDADIELVADGEKDTRVTLTGVYRPPLGAVGAGLDRVLLHRVAVATIGSLLAHLAQALAPTAPAATEADAPVSWETGPEATS